MAAKIVAQKTETPADALTLRAPSCTMKQELVGRLAQRLERSVYTRKVVRSNRTVPTIVTFHPPAGT